MLVPRVEEYILDTRWGVQENIMSTRVDESMKTYILDTGQGLEGG